MSSNEISKYKIEAWIVLIASAILTLWYANPQILYSLYFLYGLAQSIFPGLLPDPISPGA